MKLADARQAVYAVFDAAWSAQDDAPPVSYDNDAYEPPADGSPYALVFMRETSSAQVSLGAPGERLYERQGIVQVRVYAPAGQEGTDASDRMAEVARAALEGASAGDVDLFSSVVRPSVVDGRWFVASVDTTFRYLTVQ